jgi:hypothetical protein
MDLLHNTANEILQATVRQWIDDKTALLPAAMKETKNFLKNELLILRQSIDSLFSFSDDSLTILQNNLPHLQDSAPPAMQPSIEAFGQELIRFKNNTQRSLVDFQRLHTLFYAISVPPLLPIESANVIRQQIQQFQNLLEMTLDLPIFRNYPIQTELLAMHGAITHIPPEASLPFLQYMLRAQELVIKARQKTRMTQLDPAFSDQHTPEEIRQWAQLQLRILYARLSNEQTKLQEIADKLQTQIDIPEETFGQKLMLGCAKNTGIIVGEVLGGGLALLLGSFGWPIILSAALASGFAGKKVADMIDPPVLASDYAMPKWDTAAKRFLQSDIWQQAVKDLVNKHDQILRLFR